MKISSLESEVSSLRTENMEVNKEFSKFKSDMASKMTSFENQLQQMTTNNKENNKIIVKYEREKKLLQSEKDDLLDNNKNLKKEKETLFNQNKKVNGFSC